MGRANEEDVCYAGSQNHPCGRPTLAQRSMGASEPDRSLQHPHGAGNVKGMGAPPPPHRELQLYSRCIAAIVAGLVFQVIGIAALWLSGPFLRGSGSSHLDQWAGTIGLLGVAGWCAGFLVGWGSTAVRWRSRSGLTRLAPYAYLSSVAMGFIGWLTLPTEYRVDWSALVVAPLLGPPLTMIWSKLLHITGLHARQQRLPACTRQERRLRKAGKDKQSRSRPRG